MPGLNAVAIMGEDIQLLRLLGRGGMGTVWLGRRDGRLVAVKMILPKLSSDPLAVARFARELRILDKLRAQHAVRLVGTGTHDGVPYGVMENVAGGSLADRFDVDGRPPRAIAFRLVQRLLSALAEVHAEGVVHRDVKPANIMLCAEDSDLDVRLVDFGVASSGGEPRIASEDGEATVVGTGPYMSPEQLSEGGEGTVHEDLWAAGVVAYECVVGRLPFDGPSFAGVYLWIDKGAFLAPSLAFPHLPPALDAWFARAFSRHLDERFADAEEMAAAWNEATEGAHGPLDDRPWSSDEPTRHLTAPTMLTRPIRRQKGSGTRRRRLGAYAVAAVLAVTALVLVRGAFLPS